MPDTLLGRASNTARNAIATIVRTQLLFALTARVTRLMINIEVQIPITSRGTVLSEL
jgi:hypothetical protein